MFSWEQGFWGVFLWIFLFDLCFIAGWLHVKEAKSLRDRLAAASNSRTPAANLQNLHRRFFETRSTFCRQRYI